jgi:hypothetical protein
LSPGAAPGCDAFTPVRGPDGRHYTSYGDCSGLTGTLPRLSMGFGRIQGGPTNISVQDLPTPDLTDVGHREAGYKPASALIVGTRMYMWVRNYAPGGAQSRLKYSDNFMQAKSTWTWSVNLTNFGYPVFVQGAPGGYLYIVAYDNNSAYWSGEQPWGKWVRIYSTTKWDMSPGERGEFPIAWMGKEPISAAGTLHLLFSGQDELVVRRATVAPGF